MQEDLASSIEIGCVYPKHDYYFIYLAWANEAADRALEDIRFTYDPEEERVKGNTDPLAKRGWRISGIFPGNHGAVLAAACFSRALRDNSAIDDVSLLQAAEEIATSALNTSPKEWNEIPQSDYLRCVRFSLIAGRLDKAKAFLKNCRRKFKFTQEHYAWLFQLCQNIEAANGASLDLSVVAHFNSFFDFIRNPDIHLVGEAKAGNAVCTNILLLRLELALIKQRYVLMQPYENQWLEILNLISK